MKINVTAISVVCHEIGHAIQHNENYKPLERRQILVKNTAWISKLGGGILYIGLPTLFATGSFPLIRVCLILVIFTIIINLITLNNLKYYNGTNIHLLENVKLYSGGRSGFGYQAELITSQIRHKKTYIEIEIGPYPETSFSRSLSLRNITSVIVSIISIFLKQIIYVLKKFSK